MASNASSGGAEPRQGSLSAKYDDAGNLTDLAVNRATPGGLCLGGDDCNQRFRYDWDEVGRFSVARRWDASSLVSASEEPVGHAAVELRHIYDSSDQRVLKTAIDVADEQSHTVYAFGSVELRRTTFGEQEPSVFDYQRSDETEVGSLFAHDVRLARLHRDEGVPFVGEAATGLHVLLQLGDHLGSTTTVLDKATSELVEKGTYQGYGATESDYRPGRWAAFREDYRFTGKEEDADVGLTYFGKRFLNPSLGRWMSADPLAVHTHGDADLNLYAYVHGRLLAATDATGLDDEPVSSDAATPSETFGDKAESWFLRNADTAMSVTAGVAVGATAVASLGIAMPAAGGLTVAEASTVVAEGLGSLASAAAASWRSLVGSSATLASKAGNELAKPSPAVEEGKQLVQTEAPLSKGLTEAAVEGTKRVTQFCKPSAGSFGPGATRALESPAPKNSFTRLVDGTASASWVAPKAASELNWFSRLMTGRGSLTHYVEFNVSPGELTNPGGIKSTFSPWQQVIPGGVDLAGRNAAFGQLGPNYRQYLFMGGLGLVGGGLIYHACKDIQDSGYGAFK